MIARLGLAVATILALTASGYLLTSHVEPFSIESLLPESHPTRLSYETYREHYNDEKVSYLLVSREDRPFHPSEIYSINRQATRHLEKVPYVEAVRSLNSIETLEATDDGFRFVEFLNPNAKQLPRDDLWSDEFVATGGKAFILQVDFGKNLSPSYEAEAFSALFAAVDSLVLPGSVESHLFGTKVARHHMVLEMVRNQTIVLPIVIVLMAMVMYLLFRSFTVILLTMYIVLMSYVSTLIMVILLEGKIDPYSSYALFLVLIIGTADLVHFFSAWRENQVDSWPKQLQIIRSRILIPCSLTTLTTMACFLSLCLNNAPPVRAFGLYCALGTGICFVMTFYFLPLLIKYTIGSRRLPKGLWAERIYPPKLLFSHGKKIQLGTGLLAVLALIGASQLELEDNFYEKFVDAHPLSRATTTFGEHFGFLGTVDVILRSPNAAWLSPDKERDLSRLVGALEKLPNVHGVRSLSDFLTYIRPIIGADRESNFQTHEDLSGVIHLFDTLGLTDSYYRHSANEIRIVLRLKEFGTSALTETLQNVDAILEGVQPRLQGEVNGFSALRSEITRTVTVEFLQSFGASFALLAVLFYLLFGRVKIMALAMIPNMYPILILAGVLGFFGAGIEDNLVLIVCVVFGIAVDDTIHFLWALKQQQADPHSVSIEDVHRTYGQVAPALVATTAIFFVALPAFLLMEMKLFIQVGSLMVLGLSLALLCDLVLLPTFLVKERKVE